MAMSNQIMDISLINGQYEQESHLKSEELESPSDPNAFMSMAGFGGNEFEFEGWSKSSSLPFGLGTPDWYVTSISRDSESSASSAPCGAKQITIRLPLRARPCQLGECTPKLASDEIQLNPSCLTPTSAEVRGGETTVVKAENNDELLDCPFARWSTVCHDRVSAEKHQESTFVKPCEPLRDNKGDDQPESPASDKVRRTRKPRTYKYDPKPLKRKESKRKIPEDMKDDEYFANRKRNNEAARKSRQNRRQKELELIEKMHNLKTENAKLKQQIKKLSECNADYERKLAVI